ncbi:Transposase [Clostridium sp. DSM 8431]|nr:Transposase [Clostridium sp. DSM 8431]
MYVDNYFKILENIKLLSNSAKRKLLIDISILINVSNNKETAELICPHCKNKCIVKNGRNKETQRYPCKTCKKSFVKSTNAPIFSSKKNLETCIKFIECLINQYSLSKIAKELNIAVSTAFI